MAVQLPFPHARRRGAQRGVSCAAETPWLGRCVETYGRRDVDAQLQIGRVVYVFVVEESRHARSGVTGQQLEPGREILGAHRLARQQPVAQYATFAHVSIRLQRRAM